MANDPKKAEPAHPSADPAGLTPYFVRFVDNCGPMVPEAVSSISTLLGKGEKLHVKAIHVGSMGVSFRLNNDTIHTAPWAQVRNIKWQ